MTDGLLERTIKAVFKAVLGDESSSLNPDGTLKQEIQNGMVFKQFDEEQKLVLGVVLEPEVADLHKDIYDAEEVAKACDNFNTHCMKGNLEHIVNTDELEITKSFILPVDAIIGSQPVKAGSWLLEMKVHNDTVWKGVKEGDFTGFSIGGSAYFEDLE